MDKGYIYYIKGMVFPLSKNDILEIYGVEGKGGVYQVEYQLKKGIYTCSCPNIRNTPCAHIKAVTLYKEANTSPNLVKCSNLKDNKESSNLSD